MIFIQEVEWPSIHKNNSSRQDHRANRKKYRLKKERLFRAHPRKDEIGYRFAKKNDHERNACGRSIEIYFSVFHIHRIQNDESVKQPCGDDP